MKTQRWNGDYGFVQIVVNLAEDAIGGIHAPIPNTFAQYRQVGGWRSGHLLKTCCRKADLQKNLRTRMTSNHSLQSLQKYRVLCIDDSLIGFEPWAHRPEDAGILCDRC